MWPLMGVIEASHLGVFYSYNRASRHFKGTLTVWP
jgi:hypothetical protein